MKGLQNRERIWYLNEYILLRTDESADVLDRLYTKLKAVQAKGYEWRWRRE